MVFYIILKFNVFVVCCLVSCSHGKCTDINMVKTQWINIHTNQYLSFIHLLELRNTTVYSREVTKEVTTEWPWPWHPDIHWYHPYLNLSLDGPDIWEALHLGVLTKLRVDNMSHAAYKWVAKVTPNFTAVDILYRERYEGTGKNMTVCLPSLLGTPYPDWATREFIFRCAFYTPESVAHVIHLKKMRYLYNREKPMVDVHIGLGTVITAVGVPGKYSFDRHLH